MITINFHIGKEKHVYPLPAAQLPFTLPHGPGPVNFPELLLDGTVLAAIQSAAANLSDPGVREAITKGIVTAAEALQRRGGSHVTVELTPTNAAAHASAHASGR